ncbi:ATP-binding protein [Nesterenkonia sp. F]|uniref:sensor histidine kinase n=1 Tax=Nesterenkonia sp. F TaxID=795955 RepID=UPI000255CF9E|nr:ATP-binding protein [Nesterenkonia sp. F]
MAAPRRRRRIPLSRRLFLVNVLLLVGIVLAVGALWFVHERREVHQEYEHRAMTMAETVAAMPQVREDLTAEDPAETLAPLAETLRKASGFRYIVIVDRHGIRQSHPVEEAIGRPPHTDPTPVLEGEIWTGTERGPAGLTLRARVPVRGDDGETVLGYVSAGILAGDVRVASREDVPYILGVSGLVLLLGAAAAHLLARRIRADTRGLEPEQIAELLDSREALLHAIGDGVLALDHDGRIVLANPPARRLLGLPADDAETLGRSPRELGLDEALAVALVDGPSSGSAEDAAGERDPDRDATDAADAGELLAAGDRILICRRRRVRPEEPDGGTVITLRDQTDLRRLAEQLDGAQTVTRGLRVQRHEFANRIHTVAGMLELGAVERARAFVAELSAETTRDGAEIAARLADPAVAALTLAKAAQAAERQTEFTLTELSSLPDDLDSELRDDLLLIIGNLVDNALDAAGAGGRVELLVRQHALGGVDGDVVEVRVTDSGPGLAAGEDQVFAAGFSTKTGAAAERGLGLALVRQACRRRGGEVVVDAEEETIFSAYLPREPSAEDRAPASADHQEDR